MWANSMIRKADLFEQLIFLIFRKRCGSWWKSTTNELLLEWHHYKLSKQLHMRPEEYPGLVHSYRSERKNRELKKLFWFLLVPRSVVELLQIQVKRWPAIATCKHSDRQQTLIFKVLSLQQTKGRIVTRTQKPTLKIQAMKTSWPLEIHASQQKKECPQPSVLPPSSCWHKHPCSCRVIHTGNQPTLAQQRKWFVPAQALPWSKSPHGSTNICASRRKGEEAGTTRAAGSRRLDCFSKQHSWKQSWKHGQKLTLVPLWEASNYHKGGGGFRIS